MLSLLLRKLGILPLYLVLANFVGYAHAYYFGPVHSAFNPYSLQGGKLPPIIPEYLAYVRRMLSGDFGYLNSGEPVISAISRSLAASLGLVLLSLVLSGVLGLCVGMRALRTDPPGVASWLTIASTLGLASPSFFIGIILVSLSVIYVIWGPGSEPLLPFQGFGWDAHLVLPTLALMAIPTVKVAQLTSSLMAGELGKQYIVAARSFGHSVKSILWRHAFRNVIVPVLLTISGSLRYLVVELIIVERLFSWPGFGQLLANTLVVTHEAPDLLHPPLLAMLMSLMVGIFFLSDLFAVMLAQRFDPRSGISR